MARSKLLPLGILMSATALLIGCLSAKERSCTSAPGGSCLTLVEKHASEPPIEPDQLMFFATLCDRGRVDGCASLAVLCAVNGDAKCAELAIERGCALGSAELCAMIEPDCSTESACIETLQAQEQRLLADRTAENQSAYFKTMDELCHTFQRGDACLQTAQQLENTGGPPEKVLEHVLLACQFGNVASCRMVEKAVSGATASELKTRCFDHGDADACYKFSEAMLSKEPEQAKVLMKWVCEDKKHAGACRKCKELNLGCKSRNGRNNSSNSKPHPI